jgi:hypothetical protein
MNGIFLYTWRIFGLHGKNIPQRLCVVHKSSTHHSCPHIHMVVTLFHQHVKQVLCFVHLVMCSAFVGGTIAGVSKIDRLKALVVPFFPHVLLVYDEEVNMS